MAKLKWVSFDNKTFDTIEDGSDLLDFIEDTFELNLLKEYIEIREALGKRLSNV